MEYTAERGIPHSRFLSWNPDDQDKIIAWVQAKRSECPRCGTNSDHYLDAEGRRIEPDPYIVKTVRCYGCVAMEEEREFIPEGEDRGVYMFMVENPEFDGDLHG